MSIDSTVIAFRQPDAIDDPLTELAREGARRMLAQVLIAEADAFVAMWKDVKLADGRDRIVRHGHGPHRAIQTGVGPVEVRRAKVRDRGDVEAEEKIRFSSAILPKWARRTGRDLAADGGVAGGLRRLAEARSLGTAIRVRVGGRGLPSGPDGR